MKNDKFQEKYNEVWNEVNNAIKNDLTVNLFIMNLQTKTKSYEGKISTNFHDNKIPKISFQGICLLVILIDSVFRKNVNCYLQTF